MKKKFMLDVLNGIPFNWNDEPFWLFIVASGTLMGEMFLYDNV